MYRKAFGLAQLVDVLGRYHEDTRMLAAVEGPTDTPI